MQLELEQVSVAGLNVNVVALHNPSDLPDALNLLHIPTPQRSLVLVGGASKISATDLQRLQHLFTAVLAPLAQQLNLVVIDGGTDAGIMQLMGQARQTLGATFPLIGIAPIGLVTLPGQPSPHPEAATLEPNHSHCFLIPGSQWGNESTWIAQSASIVASGLPVVTVLINGGNVTWNDAQCSIAERHPLVVIRGSGRTADVIAAAARGEAVEDERAHPLVQSGLVHTVELNADDQELWDALLHFLSP